SLHHTHLVHTSRPNLSADRRIGLGLSYIPTNLRCTSRTRLTAMLVRGTDRYGHFDDEPRPRVDVGAAERTVHADAVARFRASNASRRTATRRRCDRELGRDLDFVPFARRLLRPGFTQE